LKQQSKSGNIHFISFGKQSIDLIVIIRIFRTPNKPVQDADKPQQILLPVRGRFQDVLAFLRRFWRFQNAKNRFGVFKTLMKMLNKRFKRLSQH